MSETVHKAEVQNVLALWQAGTLTGQQVYDWANDRFATERFEAEDEVTNEVLAELDTLDMNLTTTEDIPYLMQLLAIPIDRMDLVVSLQAKHAKSIDIKARQKALSADPLYTPFCK